MKSQALSCSLIASAASEFGFNPKRDCITVVERVRHEGDEFLTITLPRLNDLLLEGLSSSSLPSLEGWGKKRGTEIPEFLYDLWTKIFDTSGVLLPSPSVRAIYWIRQISVAFKKVFAVCEPQYVEKAINSFYMTDLGLPRRVHAPETISEIAHWLFGKPVGRAMSSWSSVYQNGPGAVADRLDVNERWDFPTISPYIESMFGAERFRATWGDLLFHYPMVKDIPARLTAVPKTAVKPRLISIEPSHNQYLQQSLMSALYDELTLIPALDIRRQEPNQQMAKRGSQDQSLATMDLSEASDRVSFDLVMRMFSWNPSFTSFLEATRSREVQSPDGTIFHLRKFASMGSALTFPVETMVFMAITIMGMCIQDGDVSRSNALKHLHSGDVRVYGDDIVMPTPYFQSVASLLEKYGLKVNFEKSFSTGSFRESCGKDWYQGYDVTPIYVRRPVDDRLLPWDSIVSLVAFHNQIWLFNGDNETTRLLQEILDENLIGIPRLRPESAARTDWRSLGKNPETSIYSLAVGGLHLYSHSEHAEFRFNPDLHRKEVKTWTVVAKAPTTRGTDRGKLLQALVGPESDDPDRLYRGGRPNAARLKRRWRALR